MLVNLPARYTATGTVFPGGQGDVYVYTDNSLQRMVAVKVLRDVADQDALRAELRALSAIQSKHVVQPFDLVEDTVSGRLALIQEYVPGNDLDGYVAPDLQTYLKVLFQIASALADVHAAGLIHRDIKPRNMKFDDEWIVKVFDLTLTCDIDDAETTAFRGTNYYRGPEMFAAAPVILTPAVDVYAFGVTAWKVSRGDLPWQLRAMPTAARPDSFGTHALNIPTDVANALDECLEPDPSKRPSARSLRDLFKKHILFGRHVGQLVHQGRTAELTTAQPTVRVNAGPIESVTIKYDGLDFLISNFAGDVSVNGIAATINGVLPGSCVITIGADSLGSARQHLTFDVSHPEVVI